VGDAPAATLQRGKAAARRFVDKVTPSRPRAKRHILRARGTFLGCSAPPETDRRSAHTDRKRERRETQARAPLALRVGIGPAEKQLPRCRTRHAPRDAPLMRSVRSTGQLFLGRSVAGEKPGRARPRLRGCRKRLVVTRFIGSSCRRSRCSPAPGPHECGHYEPYQTRSQTEPRVQPSEFSSQGSGFRTLKVDLRTQILNPEPRRRQGIATDCPRRRGRPGGSDGGRPARDRARSPRRSTGRQKARRLPPAVFQDGAELPGGPATRLTARTGCWAWARGAPARRTVGRPR